VTKEFEDRPLDDAEFDDYLQRGSDVSQRYRELESRALPSALDEKVLRQAQLHAGSRKPARPRWLRWGPPLAMAATTLITLSVLFLPETSKVSRPAAFRTPAESKLQERYDARAEPAPTAAAPESDAAGGSSARQAGAESPAAAASVLADQSESSEVLALAAPPAPDAVVAPKPKLEAPASAISTAPARLSSVLPEEPPAQRPEAQVNPERRAAVAQDDGFNRTSIPSPLPPDTEITATQAITAASPVDRVEAAKTSARAAQEQASARADLAKTLGRSREEAKATANDAAFEPEASLELDRAIAPQTWVKWIRELRAEGKSEQAAAFVKRLRAAHPEFRVPVEVAGP
jgi:hypothetical protein